MQMETSFESDCPPRREYVFIPDRTIGSLSLRRISTEYASFLRRTNNNVQRLQHKGRSSSRAVPHRCPGYRRDEVTLGTSVLRTAIIQHMTPSPREICPVCKQLVEDGMFYCSCGQGDDGMSPTIQCLRCRVWSHRTCQSNGDSIGHPLFTCASCRPILEHNSGSLRGHLPVDQGGRTVLPPISALPNTHFPVPSSYSNHYTQPRSSPRYDYTGAVYNQWPVGTNPASSSQSALYPYYENHENRALQQNYNSYQLGLSHQDNTVDSRRLPPLATSQAHGRDNRWQSHDGSSYPMFSSGLGASGVHIRSPTASYPTSYPASFSNGPNHGYSMPTSTPYGRSSGHVSASYSQPPVSPTSSEEPTIKKKRKRADANQLKILVETYNRTAFPSTEERLELAKVLDMTPRSVQIWFQNKRQSMRQTRQASTNSSTQQAFTMSSLLEAITSIESDSGYNMHKARVSPTFTFAHPRHARSQEADIVNPRKWSRAY
ncbi:hypothetical protein C8J56DRAFT_959672 [Mycena floridula]|nr:hypothetical protein C8J56DRAFT_959672 [Mycena floridula]